MLVVMVDCVSFFKELAFPNGFDGSSEKLVHNLFVYLKQQNVSKWSFQRNVHNFVDVWVKLRLTQNFIFQRTNLLDVIF